VKPSGSRVGTRCKQQPVVGRIKITCMRTAHGRCHETTPANMKGGGGGACTFRRKGYPPAKRRIGGTLGKNVGRRGNRDLGEHVKE